PDVDLRINLRGVRRAVAEDLADLVQRRPRTEHPGRQGMPEEVRPREVGSQYGYPRRTTNERAEGTGVGQTPVRRPGSDEDAPRRAGRAMVAQVAGQGFADIGREWETVVRAPLAPHLQHAGPPVDVLEFQGDHFAGPQSQAGQQENDGLITAGDGGVP